MAGSSLSIIISCRPLKANAPYEEVYPLTAALARPLMAKLLVQTAHQEKADTVAHGCTGKGNDQVRFDISIRVLDPFLKIIAPGRKWEFSRPAEIEYAWANGITIEVNQQKPYSTDQNIWGRSIECGLLEDAQVEPRGYL